jgi:hypothetical protein
MIKKTPGLLRVFRNLTGVWLGASLWLALSFLPTTLASADRPAEIKTDSPITAGFETASDVSTQAISPPVLKTPVNGATITNPRPAFDWDDAEGAVISYTLLITGNGSLPGATITSTESTYTPTQTMPNGVYTWTVQAHNGPEVSGYVTPPYTFTLETTWLVYLPLVIKPEPTSSCPTTSTASFDFIPFSGAAADHPDYLHGDLNLSLRGYVPTSEALELVDYNGSFDSNAPQLAGLFEPNRFPGISTVFQVYDWDWGCGEHGCRNTDSFASSDFNVTLIGLVTTPGEPIYIPERDSDIYPGGYRAMVLYAEERRITLKYTREDNVIFGYTVHIENVCVDPNLLALYQAQTDSEGWHVTGHLPALRNNQVLGIALNTEIQVAIRDIGKFMDPRSRKDWWQGY